MREFDSWATTECDICATEFQVTRTEARSYPDTDGTVICGDCWEYKRGVEDSEKRIAELEAMLKTCKANSADAINDLMNQLHEAKKNAAFFRSCALSGEVPKEGSEPFPAKEFKPPSKELLAALVGKEGSRDA